jgi:ankyrin repeat protein
MVQISSTNPPPLFDLPPRDAFGGVVAKFLARDLDEVRLDGDLRSAVRAGDRDKVRELLARTGGKALHINAEDAQGNNAIQNALLGEASVEERALIIADLVDAGVDLTNVNDEGLTAADMAASADSALADAVREGLKRQLKTSVLRGTEDRSAALIDALTGMGGEPAEETLVPGVTLLMFAAGNKNADTVEKLLAAMSEEERAAHINDISVTGTGSTFAGDTALHLAARIGDERAYDLLVAAGADENQANEAGQTPHDLMHGTISRRSEGGPEYDPELNPLWQVGNFFATMFNNGLNAIPTGYGGVDYEPATHTETPTFTAPTTSPLATGTGTPITAQQEALTIAARIGQRLGIDVATNWARINGGARQAMRLGSMRFYADRNAPMAAQEAWILTRLREIEYMISYDPDAAADFRTLFSGQAYVIVEPGEENAHFWDPETRRSTITLTGVGGFEGNLAPWATPAGSPPDVQFRHEIAHAVALHTNTYVAGGFYAGNIWVESEEERATGLVNPNAPGSENLYRQRTGRPIRTFYGHPAEDYSKITRPQKRDETEVGRSVADGYELIADDEAYDALLARNPDFNFAFSTDEEFGRGIIRFHQVTEDGEVVNKGVIDAKATPQLAARARMERDAFLGTGSTSLKGLVYRLVKPGWSPPLIDAATREIRARLGNGEPSPELTREIEDLAASILRGDWKDEEVAALRDSGLLDGVPALKEALDLHAFDRRPRPTKQDYEDALNALAVGIRDEVGRPADSWLVPAVEGDHVPHYKTIATYVLDHLREFAGGKDRSLSDDELKAKADDILRKAVPDVVRDRVEHAFSQAGMRSYGKDIAGTLHDALTDNDPEAFRYSGALRGIFAEIIKSRDRHG